MKHVDSAIAEAQAALNKAVEGITPPASGTPQNPPAPAPVQPVAGQPAAPAAQADPAPSVSAQPTPPVATPAPAGGAPATPPAPTPAAEPPKADPASADKPAGAVDEVAALRQRLTDAEKNNQELRRQRDQHAGRVAMYERHYGAIPGQSTTRQASPGAPPVQAAQTPAAAPAAQPAPPVPSDAQVHDDVIANMKREFGEDYVQKHAGLINAYVKSALEQFNGALRPVLDQVTSQVQRIEADRAVSFEQRYLETLNSGVPNWEQILPSEQFQAWLDRHPWGHMYRSILDPPEGQVSNPEDVVKVFREYGTPTPLAVATPSNSTPTLTPEQQASQARAAAAAADDRGPPVNAPPILPVTPGVTMTRSQLKQEFEAVKTNPDKLRELVDRTHGAIRGNTFHNDQGRPRTAY